MRLHYVCARHGVLQVLYVINIQVVEAKCPLLGYALESLRVDGTFLPKGLLQVDHQPEVGIEGYEAGARILNEFFKNELGKFATPQLDELGRRIIECCMDDGKLSDYIDLIPMKL